jgi:peptide subunit release factor RF-3
VENAVHNLSKQVEEKIRGTPHIDVEQPSAQAPFSLPEQCANVAGLKKKERQKGGSKRKKTWVEKLQKKKKKGNRKKISKPIQHEESGNLMPESQAYESISSFNQVLMVCRHIFSVHKNSILVFNLTMVFFSMILSPFRIQVLLSQILTPLKG